MGIFTSLNRKNEDQENISSETLRVIIISDTHNNHRKLNLPKGDVLIHAGDYTNFGKKEHAEDFNAWLGEQKFKHKLVINGNHEVNAPWQKDVKSLISNATYLKGEAYCIERSNGEIVKFFGLDFCWPMKEGCKNPDYANIDNDTNVLLCHGPVFGYVDGGYGCKDISNKIEMLKKTAGLIKYVVSGHIHTAYGMSRGKGRHANVTFINAANVGTSRTLDPLHPPTVIDI